MRVISEKQREAARENGKKSKGRPPGSSRLEKAVVALTLTLDNEPRRYFRDVLESYLDAFQPASVVECDLVEELAADYWRIRRLWSVHTSMVNRRLPDDLPRHPSPKPPARPGSIGAFLDSLIPEIDRTSVAYEAVITRPEFIRVLRAEQDYRRSYARNLRTLALLQNLAPRPPASDPPPSDPTPLTPEPVCVTPEPPFADAAAPVPAPAENPVEAPTEAPGNIPSETPAASSACDVTDSRKRRIISHMPASSRLAGRFWKTPQKPGNNPAKPEQIAAAPQGRTGFRQPKLSPRPFAGTSLGKTYQQFLSLWKNGDIAVRILPEAKAAYAKLP